MRLAIQNWRTSFWQAVLCLLLFNLAGSQSVSSSIKLQPQDLEKQVQRIELHQEVKAAFPLRKYEINLVKGQLISVSAKSDELISDLTIKTINDVALASDGYLTAPGNLLLCMEIPETRLYRIEMEGTASTYTLLVKVIENPDSEFLTRAKSQRLHTEFNALYYSQQRDHAAFLKMLEIGEELTQLQGQIGRPNLQIEVLALMAEARRQLGELEKAIEVFERALAINRFTNLPEKEAELLTFIGMCRYQFSDYRRAISAFQQALSVWDKEIANGRLLYNMQGWTLIQLGSAELAIGEWRQARDTFLRSADMYESYYRRRPGGDHTHEWHFGLALCLRGLGRTYSLAGEKQRAIDTLTEALEHFKGAGDGYYEPLLLNEMGELYASLGDSEQALSFYERALKAEQRMGSRAAESQTLYLIGRLFQFAGKSNEAEHRFREASEIRQTLGDRRGLAAVINGIGEIQAARGEWQAAVSSFESSLGVQSEIRDRFGESASLTNLGAAHTMLGDETRAANYLNQSLSLLRQLGDRSGEASALYQLAKLAKQNGQLENARQLVEAALKQTEFIRANVLSQELRASYLGTVRDYYEFYVDLLMRLHQQRPKEGFDQMALKASETARARSLLDSLAETRIDIRSGVPADLLARERQLQQRLSAKAEAQLRLQTQPHAREAMAELSKEVQTITADYRQTLAKIRAVSPSYAALVQPQPLTTTEIRALLDDGVMLLEYSLGAERSFLWAVTREGMKSYVLPARDRINAAAKRVYELLAARNRFLQLENTTQRQARIAQSDAELPQATAELSQMILLPVAARLTNQRLVIVAQEALQFVPFSILPKPIGVKQPMIIEHDISYLPSASVLGLLRQESAARQIAPKQLAVIADPVFNADDARVTLRGGTSLPTDSPNPDLLRALKSSGDADQILDAAFSGRVQRLPGTRREAEQISSLVVAESRLQAMDFAANRSLAIGQELNRYRIVHFATHALVNVSHPELSGIVLSLVDERGCPQNGFLSATDIYNLRLSADLVVLSACQTGLGKEIRGEGLVGMTRSFMHAGASRVVVSLWSQQDKATADLMIRFYGKFLTSQSSPSAALRAAQIEMMKSGRWPSPYFWSGFTLQGEYR
ncbi:MAG: CHAT domain-containing protein [Blastocatellia bacterium]